MFPPQPSGMVPQFAITAAHVVGVQHWLFEHCWPIGQVPQLIGLPQPSSAPPH